jgi:DNA-3-methyladenine glycosylase
VVARDLLGRTLCRRLPNGSVLRAQIVEVEAYDGPDDGASHARCGKTARNAPMFEAGGRAYVYLVYGMHHCLNVVTWPSGYPSAILLRATEPVGDGRSASGPGRLCKAFGVDRSLDGCSLLGRVLWLEAGEPVSDDRVRRTERIGVAYAGACASRPYRFVVRGHASASGPRRMR